MKTALLSLSLVTLLLAMPVFAHDAQQKLTVDERLDLKGDRINVRMDQQGAKINAHLDEKAQRLEERGHSEAAKRMALKGDRIAARFDRQGNRINRHLDRVGDRGLRRPIN